MKPLVLYMSSEASALKVNSYLVNEGIKHELVWFLLRSSFDGVWAELIDERRITPPVGLRQDSWINCFLLPLLSDNKFIECAVTMEKQETGRCGKVENVTGKAS